ncbi:MAG: signal peptidase I [Erysipelotrichaceae bacterium]|nr:signal peptidase I [Erysipelotrichaceae bacterium]
MNKISSFLKSFQKNDIIITIIDFITTFITAFIAIIAIALVVINLIGWHVFSIDSSSMTPAYPINTLVIVQNVDASEIQVGDVITYVLNDDGVLVTHRVVNKNNANETFITKGDANNVEDASPVSFNNVIGKVVLGFPIAGGVLRIITASENRIIVILCIIILFMFSFIWDMIARKRKSKGKEEEK